MFRKWHWNWCLVKVTSSSAYVAKTLSAGVADTKGKHISQSQTSKPKDSGLLSCIGPNKAQLRLRNPVWSVDQIHSVCKEGNVSLGIQWCWRSWPSWVSDCVGGTHSAAVAVVILWMSIRLRCRAFSLLMVSRCDSGAQPRCLSDIRVPSTQPATDVKRWPLEAGGHFCDASFNCVHCVCQELISIPVMDWHLILQLSVF